MCSMPKFAIRRKYWLLNVRYVVNFILEDGSEDAEEEDGVTVEEAAEDLALPQSDGNNSPQAKKMNTAYYFYQG